MFSKKVLDIPVKLIFPNPNQPRKVFDEEEIDNLANSIIEFGILQPLIVSRGANGVYYLVAGERRLRAAKKAGLNKVPVIFRELSDKDNCLIALIENIQRENLNYIEEAYALKKLIEEHNFSQGELAAKVGKKQSTISNKLRIITMSDNVLSLLNKYNLSERHARALLKLDNESDRIRCIEYIYKNGLNVKQTERYIDSLLINLKEQSKKGNCIKMMSYKIYANSIRKTFNQIHSLESNARFVQSDLGDNLEIKILLPKNA